jgi:hypothetical protein
MLGNPLRTNNLEVRLLVIIPVLDTYPVDCKLPVSMWFGLHPSINFSERRL